MNDREPGASAAPPPLPPEALAKRSDPEALPFQTTAELEPLRGLIAQDRALSAVRFGSSIRHDGFNIFALGPEGAGKHTAIRDFLEAKSADEPPPDDWVYVNNFESPHRPKALRLPPGRAVDLRNAMRELVRDLSQALRALFESEEYESRRKAIDEGFSEKQEEAFRELEERGRSDGIAVLRTPMGFAMAPIQDGQVMKPEVFNELPKTEQDQFRGKIESLQKDLEQVLHRLPKWEKERRAQLRDLNQDLAKVVVDQELADVEQAFADIEAIRLHLDEVRKDLIENVALFLMQDESEASQSDTGMAQSMADSGHFRRYMVNVLVSNGNVGDGAPVVAEQNPTTSNLIGRVEHLQQMGALITDFLLIKPGALHRANGGYLLLDARKLFTQPFAWEALKRALRSNAVEIESIASELSLIHTVSLEPEPIPLRTRVVLFGDRLIYYLLCQLDPDFLQYFKVAADFDDTVPRDDETQAALSRLIAAIIERDRLKPVDRAGVARILDHAARLAQDGEKFTARIGTLADVLREAEHWATEADRDVVTADDVGRAIREQIHRADRAREHAHEAILRNILLVDTSGEKVGQVNGLSVISLGSFSFGRPSRITARTRMGTGRVVDIEREVELGGPIHSKGVLILSGYLAAKYALDMPVSLSATLVFEQSYGGVEGDSASSAELYALLSALAELPVRQSLAVTGSVNQHGDVQAIGGVNEKIEGFFDICKSRSLTGKQGVLIPKANLPHLMLRDDVVQACAEKQFSVYAIATIEEGIELLTGRPAGMRGEDGLFPNGTVNRLVEDRLVGFAKKRKLYGARRDQAESDAAKETL
ncbi:MAG: Lon protease family protein [Methyloligellaceae bacterium]